MNKNICVRSLVWIAVLCSVLLGAGCRRTGCYAYKPILASDALSNDLADWADKNIFAKQFRKEDLVSGRLAGPGSFAVPRRKFALTLPSYVADVDGEIRVLFSKANNVVAVFIGMNSYNGIIISKDSIDSAYRELDFQKGFHENINGRVALICGG